MKWVIISLLSMMAGIAMFGEIVLKIVAWSGRQRSATASPPKRACSNRARRYS